MKKHLDQLTGTYLLKSGPLLMLSLLSISIIPFFLKSAFMLVRQNLLSPWLVILFDIIGWIMASILFYIAGRLNGGHSETKLLSGIWRSFRKGGLWLIAILLLSGTIYKSYLDYGLLPTIKSSPLVYIAGQIMVILIVCMLVSVFTFRLLCIMADPKHESAFKGSFVYWLKRPLLALGSIFSISLIFVIPLLYDYLLKNIPGLSLSFIQRISGAILLSLMQWVVLQPLSVVMFRHAFSLSEAAGDTAPAAIDIAPAGNENQINPGFIRKRIDVFITVAIIIACGLYNTIIGKPLSAVSVVKQDIQSYFTNAVLMGESGDPAAAAYYEKIAEARIFAWRGTVLNTPDAMNKAIGLAPFDTQVAFLAAESGSNRLDALEQGFLNGNHTPAWYEALLNEYSISDKLTDTQKQRKSELLRVCILQGYYSMTSVMPSDLIKNQDSFADMLDSFDDELVAGKYYSLVARAGEDGGINKQLVLDTLDMAEKYPQDINLQGLAMSYGTTFQEDNASHYGRTADAALRYDDLYLKLKAKSASESEIVNEKQLVAKSLMASGELQESVDFLSALPYKNVELSMLEASLEYSLKSYDKCLATAAEVLKENPSNSQALYLAAMSSLMLNDITGSINHAVNLAKLVEIPGGGLEAESLLYAYLMRITINDPAGGYTTGVYGSLDESQLDLLKTDDFLNNYAAAAFLWTKQNDESRTQAIELLDKVLSVNGSLSRALYMKGAICFELGRNDQALENLKASVALDDNQPTVWYALANLYDKIQNYNEAYAACQKVLEYLPSTDHASDVYGVSIHTSQLMDKLRPLVKEGN